jgi:hypothetical protein
MKREEDPGERGGWNYALLLPGSEVNESPQRRGTWLKVQTSVFRRAYVSLALCPAPIVPLSTRVHSKRLGNFSGQDSPPGTAFFFSSLPSFSTKNGQTGGVLAEGGGGEKFIAKGTPVTPTPQRRLAGSIVLAGRFVQNKSTYTVI